MGRVKFTIYHGLSASLALHSALALPFALHALAQPPEEPPTLVLELQDVVGNIQTQQKVLQQTKGEAKQDEADTAKPSEPSPTKAVASDDRAMDVTEEEKEAATPAKPTQTSSPPAEMKSGSAGANDISGTEERQNAQTIEKDREAEIERLKAYVKLLTKKVQANLVYPDEGRQAGLQGTATVSFAILRTGQIRLETLKIIATSGQPKLDTSALKTVRSSAPFDPPPKEMTVAIAVAFGRKH